MKKIIISLCAVLSGAVLWSQTTFPVNGVKQDESGIYYALTNATIWVDYQTKIEQATLVIKDGKVVSVGSRIPIPAGAVVHSLEGKWIYPSFIELNSDYGMPKVEKSRRDPRPQIESNKNGAYHWNQSIHPEVNASDLFRSNEEQADALRKAGFGVAMTHQKDGIARGTASLVLLGEGKESQNMLRQNSAAVYSFQKGSSRQSYPSSMMGSISLLKQSHHDAIWYNNNKQSETVNLSFEALNAQTKMSQFFDTRDMLEAVRADLVGDEFGIQYTFFGNGDEYQRISELQATKGKFVVPVNFPDAYDVEDPYDAQVIELSEMLHWEYAPSNLKLMLDGGLEFAISSNDLKEPSMMLANLKKAIKRGLDAQEVIKALTFTPANMIGESKRLGALKTGYYANFIVASENLFEEGEVLENWVNGDQFIIKNKDSREFVGNYEFKVNQTSYTVEIHKGNKAKIIENDSTKIDLNLSINRDLVSLSFDSPTSEKGKYRLSGEMTTSTSWQGKGQSPGGKWITWTLKRQSGLEEKEEIKKEEEEAVVELSDLRYPFMAYGWTEQPKQENVVYRNATLWTNEKEGILQESDVWMKDGKIVAVGKDLVVKEATEVDATGLHITSGIIDEHSHIAIQNGVNESGQAVTAEVSISDAVYSEDINIYRQLAGGVTASHLLHGSANPIGGQSALIKLRWGSSPEEMKIKGTPGYIKFALGENVKQSNWGDYNRVRFPQTRMGVEQVFYDAFVHAKAYEQEWKTYNALSKKAKKTAIAPRKDLEMEALVEILNSERFVSCHSYVQSEINMLMHVADSMGFTLNTFTHILEGYKVADKMKEHGAGGSTFSDWWAYKYEVNDAIPYNAAIMHKMGITTAINSDDAEMARRLNQEAAKIVKYGGVSEEEAWKMVSLNPAILLHLNERMGSLKEGKDADVVVWSHNPLSIYAKAQKTYVDGRCLFDIDTDEKLRVEIVKERSRLIQKMLEVKKEGGNTRKARKRHHHHWHCDTIGEEAKH